MSQRPANSNLRAWILGIVIAGMATFSFAATAGASDPVRLLLPRDFSDPAGGLQPMKVRPHSFHIVSADAALYFQNLRWHHWNRKRAFARGQYRWCEYLPCTERWTSTKVTVSHIKRGVCGQRFYMKARYTTDAGSSTELGATACP